MSHIPRGARPSRKQAIDALLRCLNDYPDMRIGQAVMNACRGRHNAFYIEDDVLAAGLDDLTAAAADYSSEVPRTEPQ